jgi:hypothetical protein
MRRMGGASHRREVNGTPNSNSPTKIQSGEGLSSFSVLFKPEGEQNG